MRMSEKCGEAAQKPRNLLLSKLFKNNAGVLPKLDKNEKAASFVNSSENQAMLTI
jgi:hypothetical protein